MGLLSSIRHPQQHPSFRRKPESKAVSENHDGHDLE